MLSVVIPTYNRARYLKSSLSSLEYQTFDKDKFEVIIIDDGSDDGTKKISQGFNRTLNINYAYQPHLGVSKARNLGIKKAQGEVIVFFDDDAIADKRWLENIEAIMKQEDIVVGRIEPIHNNIWQYFAPHYDHGNKPVEVEVLLEGNCAIATKVFKEIGGFDEKLTYGHEGEEFVSRASKQYKIIYYPEMVIKHDYAFGLYNYLKKQFRFGHKMAYLRGSEIESVLEFIIKYSDMKKTSKESDHAMVKQPSLFDRIFIAIIARLGNVTHAAGSLFGYFKYKNN
jgi:glycosyltransferase involved in cell wall biosynthesis